MTLGTRAIGVVASPGFGSRRGTKRHRNNLSHTYNNNMKYAAAPGGMTVTLVTPLDPSLLWHDEFRRWIILLSPALTADSRRALNDAAITRIRVSYARSSCTDVAVIGSDATSWPGCRFSWPDASLRAPTCTSYWMRLPCVTCSSSFHLVT